MFPTLFDKKVFTLILTILFLLSLPQSHEFYPKDNLVKIEYNNDSTHPAPLLHPLQSYGINEQTNK